MVTFSKAFQWTSIFFRYISKSQDSVSHHRTLPSLRGYPVIGNLLDLASTRFRQTLCKLVKSYRPACQLKLLNRKAVALNSIGAINTVLVDQDARSCGRLSLFFQQYVFENKTFGFRDFSERAAAQKFILKSYLQRQLLDDDYKDVHNELNKVKQRLEHTTDGENADLCLKSFLTNYFSRQVS